ncbi:MAG: VTT domain-containing protein [Rudaea sp.]
MFVGAFLESLAIVGTFIPGSSVVFAGGMLVGLHALDFGATTTAAVLGAIAGDGLSFWLGRHYHVALRRMWPLRTHPAILERGEAYVAVHGGKSVFLGRFVGPVRAIVPIVAGMANMPAGRFYLMNVLSALAWAAAHLLPGALFGASLQLAGAVSSRLVVLVALLVGGSWAIAWLIGAVLRAGLPVVRRLRARVVTRAGASSGPVARVLLSLLDPDRPEPYALLVAATLLVGGTWLFLGVVEDVVTRDTLVEVDRAIYGALQALRTQWGDDVIVVISELGSAQVTIAVIAAVAAWFTLARRFRTLAYWAAAAVVAELFVLALKYGLERARPPTPYALVDQFSFPSGHAAITTVVYGFLAFLVGLGKPPWQQMLYAGTATVIAVLMAFSRLYLGAHWFSDVVASFGLGMAWIALLAIAYLHHERERRLAAAPVVAIVLATLAFVGGPYAGRHHARDLGRYAKATTTPTIEFAAWRDGAWRTLPAAREEIGGERNEPFSVQWAAAPEAIERLLGAHGFRAPAPWRSSAALLWLVSSTPIGELPVLPKLEQGRAPPLTFVRAVDARERVVVRLWHAADVVREPALADATPLWIGMVTAERLRAEFGLIQSVRTVEASALSESGLSSIAPDALPVRRQGSGSTVLLIW